MFPLTRFRLFAAAAALQCSTACHRPAPQQAVHKIMIDRSITLATAESCTGGTIAARFTAMPGASAYFKYGIVAYSNDAKRNILGVGADSIGRYGVVSERIVRQMAEGVLRISNADYAIATTGIAGPTGHTRKSDRHGIHRRRNPGAHRLETHPCRFAPPGDRRSGKHRGYKAAFGRITTIINRKTGRIV